MLFAFFVLTLARLARSYWRFWGRRAFRALRGLRGSPPLGVGVDRRQRLHDGVLLGLRGPGISCVRIVDPIAIVAAILISMLIFNVEGTAALVQRVMFGIAYLWFGMEGFAEFGVTRSGSSLWPLDRSAPIPQPWKGVERRST